MWKAYLKADKYLLDKIQEGYLWLLDRTGIYAASVMFMLFCVDPGIKILQGRDRIVMGIFIAMIGLMLAFPYILQDKGDNKAYNAMALSIEGQGVRHAFMWFQYTFLVAEIYKMQGWEIAGSVAIIIYQFFWCVKIRDRDKKPFFKPAEGKQELAMERT